MTHIMQYQAGVNVLAQGLALQSPYSLGVNNPYRLQYTLGKPFSSYNIEQQGEIAAQIYHGKIPNIIKFSGSKGAW